MFIDTRQKVEMPNARKKYIIHKRNVCTQELAGERELRIKIKIKRHPRLSSTI